MKKNPPNPEDPLNHRWFSKNFVSVSVKKKRSKSFQGEIHPPEGLSIHHISWKKWFSLSTKRKREPRTTPRLETKFSHGWNSLLRAHVSSSSLKYKSKAKLWNVPFAPMAGSLPCQLKPSSWQLCKVISNVIYFDDKTEYK